MPKLVWDENGKRFYETGVKNGVLYTKDAEDKWVGVAWNGLTAVTESPSGAEATPLYADDTKYLNLTSVEEFGGTIEAYTYPDEFKVCNGEAELTQGISIGQQPRKAFGFCYRTVLGNDELENEYGYKLHLVYNAKASVSEKAYATINDSPEAITFSWEFTTTPVPVTGHKATSLLTIDSTKVAEGAMAKIEAKLYGSETEEATLPSPDEILGLITEG